MSEIKGTLLAIVLAVVVFGIVFTAVTTSIASNADTISERMKDESERTYVPSDAKVYSLNY